MALIKCNECGKEISDSAETCPHCGYRTKHGRNVVESKALSYQMIIAAIALAVGAYFVFNSWTQLNGHTSNYWRYNDDEQMKLILKLAAGIGMIVGGFIVMGQIKRKSKEMEYSNRKNPTLSSIAFIPADKCLRGTCTKCGKEGDVAKCRLPNQAEATNLCLNCIRFHRGQIL